MFGEKGMKVGIGDIKSILQEFGIGWVLKRCIYSMKLKTLRWIPISEKIYEKKVNIKRIDIFKTNVDEIEGFLKQLPKEKQRDIIGRADQVLEGKIIGFSNRLFDYGMPINWQLNPLTGNSVDKEKKWYKIADFDIDRGDIKALWEASRFSYLFFLLRAYMITRDEKYYRGFSEILDSWVKDNKYSYGANFKCGQECTLRMMNVLAVYSGFEAYGISVSKDRKNVIKIVETSYKKVCSNFFYANKCIKNDHTIAELCGMIIGSWCAEDVKKSRKYFRKLEKELKEQFSPQGMYLSYSFNYQRYVLQLMEYMIKISKVLGVEFHEDVKERLYNAAMLLYQSQSEEGKVPNYGANDGTLVFPVTVCEFRNYKPVIDTIIRLTKGESVYEQGEHEEEYLWFYDEKNNSVRKKIERKSLSCIGTGVFHYRNDKMYMMVNAHNYERRPGHMDQLHIDLWINGINVLCDTGTYSYAEETGEKLSKTIGHNTVWVEGKEQMKKIGKFLTYAVPKISVMRCEKQEFEAQLESQTGYTHKRNIIFFDDKIVIKDWVKQKGKQEPWYILFHTPCKIRQEENRIYFLNDEEKVICQLISSGGVIQIECGWASWYYLDKQEVMLIKVKCSESENIVEIQMEE